MAQSGWVLGLGTGSTTAYAIQELGRMMREEGMMFEGIPTSHSAELLARSNGIPIRTLHDVNQIQLAIDGADEIDGKKNLIKGSGGAHTREKIIDSFADQFVVVVDDSKLVNQLGQTMGVPLEVVPLAVPAVINRIGAMGGKTEMRISSFGVGHSGPAITDQGNFVLDALFETIDDPKAMEKELNLIPGVLENGIFPQIADLIIIGSTKDGSISTQ